MWMQPPGGELQLNNNFWSIKSSQCLCMGMEVEWRWTKVKFMFEALEGAFEGRYQKMSDREANGQPWTANCVASVPSNCKTAPDLACFAFCLHPSSQMFVFKLKPRSLCKVWSRKNVRDSSLLARFFVNFIFIIARGDSEAHRVTTRI